MILVQFARSRVDQSLGRQRTRREEKAFIGLFIDVGDGFQRLLQIVKGQSLNRMRNHHDPVKFGGLEIGTEFNAWNAREQRHRGHGAFADKS